MNSIIRVAIAFIIFILTQNSSAGQERFHSKSEIIDKTYRNHHFDQASISIQDSNLTTLGKWAQGPCFAVDTKDGYAFVGNGALLQVYDIQQPDSPRIVTELLTNGLIFDLDVIGNYVYLINPLQIIDISNPSNPQILSSLSISGAELLVSGTNVYVGDFSGAITIIDASNPSLPEIKSTVFASGEFVLSMALEDSLLFICTADGFVMDIFNVSSVSSPSYMGNLDLAFEAITVKDRYLYGAGFGGFSIYDIDSLLTPVFKGSVAVGGIDPETSIQTDISIEDTMVYISLFHEGFSVVNVSDKSSPFQVKRISWIGYRGRGAFNSGQFLGPFRQIVYSGNAYLASLTGLWVLDVTQDSLTTSAFVPSAYSTTRVRSRNQFAYVVSAFAGLKVLDMSVPSVPTLVNHLPTQMAAIDFAMGGDLGVLLESDYDLNQQISIIDMSDPEVPRRLSTIAFQETTINNGFGLGSITLRDSIAFVSFGAKTIKVINISNPDIPFIVKSFSTTGNVFGLEISGNYLYSAESSLGGLQVYDVTDLNLPVVSKSLPSLDGRGLLLSNNILYLANAGLAILDISDPDNPVVLGQVGTPGGRYNVDLSKSGNFVYMAYNINMEVVDVSNSNIPRIVGYRRNQNASGVSSVNSLIIVGDYFVGVSLLKNVLITSAGEVNGEVPPHFKISQNYPNPFNPTTTITYSLDRRSTVRLEIFDILGRKVLTVIDEILQPGTHSVDIDMSSMTSGVYIYRLRAHDNYLVGKMLLIR